MEQQVLEDNSITQLVVWEFIIRNKNILLKIVLWWILFVQAREKGWGELFLVLSCFYLMFANLGRREEGTLSAYSIFNPGYRELPGTLNATRLENELIYSRFPSQPNDNGYDSDNDPELLIAIQNSLREVQNESTARDDASEEAVSLQGGADVQENRIYGNGEFAEISAQYDQGYNSEEDPDLLLAIQNSLDHTHGLLKPRNKNKKTKLQKRRKNVAILKTN